MKFSPRFNRDWQFYKVNAKKFSFCGEDVKIDSSYTGVSAKQAFYALDSRGVRLPTREPAQLKAVLECKKSINLHIRMWAEGYNDMLLGFADYLAEFINPPDWVELALRRAVYSRTP